MGVFRRLVQLICVCACCWSWPVHGQQPVRVAAPATATTSKSVGAGPTAQMRLQVVQYDELGLPIEVPPLNVQLVEFKASSQKTGKLKETGAKWLKTEAGGLLTLSAPAAGIVRALRFQEAGSTAEVRLKEGSNRAIGVYQRRLTDDDVAMDVRGNLSIRDGGTSTWLEITLAALKPGVRVWTKEKPLVLPLLAPAVRGAVLDRGVITKATKNIEVQTRDAVKVLRGGGGLALVGRVAPGRPVTIRVHYGMSIKATAIDLGLRAVVGQTSFAVATIASPPVLIEMSVDRPARVAEHREGRQRYTGASIIHPLKRGETARVRLIGFPAKSTWPGRALGGVALVMFVVFGAFGLRQVRGSQ